jgi:hypothetical protein
MRSLRSERVVSQRQSKTSPDINQRFSERVDQRVVMVGRRRDAQPPGSTRDGRIIDRLDIDAVLAEQEIARFLALLRITHHHRYDVRVCRHQRQACCIEHGLYPRRALLMAVALPLRSLEVPDRRGSGGADRWRQRGRENESRRIRAHWYQVDASSCRETRWRASEALGTIPVFSVAHGLVALEPPGVEAVV